MGIQSVVSLRFIYRSVDIFVPNMKERLSNNFMKSGFVIASFIYTGKEDYVKNMTLGEKVVTKLVKAANIERGSLVVMDNFFSSCSLFESLMNREQ